MSLILITSFHRVQASEHAEPAGSNTPARPLQAAANLLVNGSFENGASSPTGWTSGGWNPAGGALTTESGEATEGGRSIKLAADGSANDLHWAQTVAVQPYTPYELSGWIKTRDIANSAEQVNAGATLSLIGTWTRTRGLLGTNDWTFVRVSFNSGDQSRIAVGGRLGYWSGATTGTAWFDDLKLVPLGTDSSVQNADFEVSAASHVPAWVTETIVGRATFSADTAAAHTGATSIKVSGAGQGIARWWQPVQLAQDSEYELSGWIKTDAVQDPAGQSWTNGGKLAIYGIDSYLAAATSGLRGTQGWTYVHARFFSGRTTWAKLACTIGEADSLYVRNTSSGTLWCDDIKLLKLRTLPRTQLAGQRVALDMYQESAFFADSESYLRRLDQVYAAQAELVGGTPYGGATITVREDSSIAYGALSGNPIWIGSGPSLVENVNRNGLDFGMVHEMGHDFDLPNLARYYLGTAPFHNGEAWANLKAIYAFEQLAEQDSSAQVELWDGALIRYDQLGSEYARRFAEPWVSAGRRDYQNMSPDTYTGLLYTVVRQVGWAPFKCAFREYGKLQGPAPAGDEGKVELWANVLSLCAQRDFVPTFRSWGFPVSAHVSSGLPPATTGLSPVRASAGSDPLTLTVRGRNFVPGSTVQWNGSPRPTTFVDPTQLVATISASDVAAGGSVPVSVAAPRPAGGTSNAQIFTVIAGGTRSVYLPLVHAAGSPN